MDEWLPFNLRCVYRQQHVRCKMRLGVSCQDRTRQTARPHSIVRVMQTNGSRFRLAQVLAILILGLSAQSAPDQKQSQAQRLQAAYDTRGDDFFWALFELPETTEIIRRHIPGVEQWVGFERSLWLDVPKTARTKMLEELGKDWDTLKEEEQGKRWRRLRLWPAISADLGLLLSSSGSIEKFHQTCFEDPLLEHAYDWLFERRPRDFGPEHVGATLATGEMPIAWSHLVLHLMEKSLHERYECFERLADKLATSESAEPAESDAPPADDKELRQILSLLSKLRMGDKYATVKKLLPKIGPLQPDAGDDNTEALLTIQIGTVSLKGEFNFAKGGLVSHGFHSAPFAQVQAQAFLGRCICIMEERHGESERRIDLPGESDGPQGELGLSFNWHKKGTLMGVDFSLNDGKATVGWGAQAE